MEARTKIYNLINNSNSERFISSVQSKDYTIDKGRPCVNVGDIKGTIRATHIYKNINNSGILFQNKLYTKSNTLIDLLAQSFSLE